MSRIWELPASTVIRKGRSFSRRQLQRFSRLVASWFAALGTRFGASAVRTQKAVDREWLRKKMSPLLAAVDAGDLERAIELLAGGADPNAVSHSSTPLNWALISKNEEMASLLLRYGADPRALGAGHQSYFQIAFNRDPNLGAWFLRQIPDVTVLDAAEAGNPEDVRRLVEAGGDVNMVSIDKRRKSPLQAAVERKNLEMVAFLLDRGADLVGRGSDYPVLFVAATHVYSAEMTDLLLRRGANPNATDRDGCTPLFGVASSVNVDVLETLIRGGADVNFRDQNGSTPLHSAVSMPDPEGRAIHVLVKHGARLDTQDSLGRTPLHIAMGRTNADAAMTLLDLGADPEIADNEGRTPVQLVEDSVKLYPGIPEVMRRMGRLSKKIDNPGI